jgi:hypothetical protein
MTDETRATAESIAADAERLADVEQAAVDVVADAAVDKSTLVELNAESEQLIGDIAAKGAIQSALLEEASAQP